MNKDTMTVDKWQVGARPLRYPTFLKLADFLNRQDLKERLTPLHPWVCFSKELGVYDLSAAGGLGYLAGDWVLLAGELGIPFIGVGLYYRTKWQQCLDEDFWQKEEFYDSPSSEKYGFEKVYKGNIPLVFDLRTNGNHTYIDVLVGNASGNPLFMLYEPGLRGLYEGMTEDEHRLYQAAVLGFAGVWALEQLGVIPSILHLNESSTVIAAVALLDSLCQKGLKIEKALEEVRSHTLFTNHTLSAAAELEWQFHQIVRYVMPNVKSDIVNTWLTDFISKQGERVKFSSLAMELSGKMNGVSNLHAEKATQSFGKKFTPITNAIANRWVYPDIVAMYKEIGIIDPIFGLPHSDYQTNLEALKIDEMVRIKKSAGDVMRKYLVSKREDQYGKPITIPPEAKIAVWARRFDEYKRPNLMFKDSKRLASILKSGNTHLLLAGKAHKMDLQMKAVMQQILRTIDENSILRERVHFIKNYDWELAFHFAGADILLNTPRVGSEACGTSWEKGVLNWLILCSTPDGGPADIVGQNSSVAQRSPYFLIKEGRDDIATADSLYDYLEEAVLILDNKKGWRNVILRQLSAFLPTANGSRMMVDYLKFGIT